MIAKQPFGRTGHESTRVIFGAAALWAMPQEKADEVLATLLAHGINHIDTAAAYGESELRVGPWMETHRDRFFLATKTGDRTYDDAKASLHRSLERLRVDRVDLIQMHNLVEEDEWEIAMGPNGALKALTEAREEGLVRFIGVTGHGTRIAAMHKRSLEHFPFDSVLLPYNYPMMQIPEYAADFEALEELCRERGVAMQTIKAVARRRWTEDHDGPKFSWYEPLMDEAAIRHAVHYVLSRPGLFLNSSSDARILGTILDAAAEVAGRPAEADLDADVQRFDMEPLFIPGVTETI